MSGNKAGREGALAEEKRDFVEMGGFTGNLW